MFTLEQIKLAHSKVTSGADFPQYIQDLRQLGIIYYETYVSDGHSNYFGKDSFQISSSASYLPLTIAPSSSKTQFQKDLQAHQQGKTNYSTFCSDCAVSGVEKWLVHIEKMTCTYYDSSNEELLAEIIPAI